MTEQPIYDTFYSMNDDELRNSLRTCGVSVHGTREVMITRLVMFALEGRQPTSCQKPIPLHQRTDDSDSDSDSDSDNDSDNDNDNDNDKSVINKDVYYPKETYVQCWRRERKEKLDMEKKHEVDKILVDIENLHISGPTSIPDGDEKTETTVSTNAFVGIGSLLKQHKNDDALRNNYNKLTVEVLKELIRKRNIKCKQTLKKSQLIDVLIKSSHTVDTLSEQIESLPTQLTTQQEKEKQIDDFTRTYVEDKLKDLFESNKEEKLEELE